MNSLQIYNIQRTSMILNALSVIFEAEMLILARKQAKILLSHENNPKNYSDIFRYNPVCIFSLWN
jgi:hypothetical protein